MISVNSLRHTPYLFQHFVGNIFEGGFVFSYVLNYFGTQNGEFCMNSSLFFGTFFVGKYFGTRNCTFLSLQLLVISVRNLLLFFLQILLRKYIWAFVVQKSKNPTTGGQSFHFCHPQEMRGQCLSRYKPCNYRYITPSRILSIVRHSLTQ